MPSTKLAIMQPYIFPYLGYFQLVNAVDTFVFYDDVTFIKGGWVNRNNILVNKQKKLFTIPLEKQSSNKLICETFININLYDKWKNKFLRSLEQSYRKSPNFEEIFQLVNDLLNVSNYSMSQLAIKSVVSVSRYLDLQVDFEASHQTLSNSIHLRAQERVIDMVKKKNANIYINAIGGQELYSKDDFKKEEIDLFFLKASLPEYLQFSDAFVPGLSIIDVLMMNSKAEVKAMLGQYELI